MTTRIVLVAFIAVSICLLSGCGKKKKAGKKQDVQECVERGIAYYKEVQAYPTLSDGRLANDVVVERCDRATTAF